MSTRTSFLQLHRLALPVLALSLLMGCSAIRLIDSDVLSVAAVPPDMSLQGAKYRFERLPSQLSNPEVGLAEQQAQAALASVGLMRDDARAALSVLVGFGGTQHQTDPWGRPVALGWMPPRGDVIIGADLGTQFGMGMRLRSPTPTHYRREVSLILRDLKTGQVVYETRASHTGPWGDSVPVFGALFQAALANFPNPPENLRRVNIELPR